MSCLRNSPRGWHSHSPWHGSSVGCHRLSVWLTSYWRTWIVVLNLSRSKATSSVICKNSSRNGSCKEQIKNTKYMHVYDCICSICPRSSLIDIQRYQCWVPAFPPSQVSTNPPMPARTRRPGAQTLASWGRCPLEHHDATARGTWVSVNEWSM